MADEAINQLKREIALLRSAQAPVIYCSGILSPGVGAGVGNMTLTTGLSISLDGKIVTENAAVARLRFPLEFIPMLREALDQIELLAKPSASDEKQ